MNRGDSDDGRTYVLDSRDVHDDDNNTKKEKNVRVKISLEQHIQAMFNVHASLMMTQTHIYI